MAVNVQTPRSIGVQRENPVLQFRESIPKSPYLFVMKLLMRFQLFFQKQSRVGQFLNALRTRHEDAFLVELTANITGSYHYRNLWKTITGQRYRLLGSSV
ncbi:MAG: hypothetical protein D6775_01630 [Caldilineae bacterium]|nr:MAG: hypothetical protein D6775_01630 [Caldilineae bacterium]